MAVYSLPNGSFYISNKDKGMPIGFVSGVNKDCIYVKCNCTGTFRLNLPIEKEKNKSRIRTRFQILKESSQ